MSDRIEPTLVDHLTDAAATALRATLEFEVELQHVCTLYGDDAVVFVRRRALELASDNRHLLDATWEALGEWEARLVSIDLEDGTRFRIERGLLESLENAV